MPKLFSGTSQSDSWSQFFERLNKLANEGKFAECRKLLLSKTPRQIPRRWAPQIGELAFRIKLYLFSLRTLHRFFAAKTSSAPAAYAQIRKIYARSLRALGSIDQAIDILRSLDPEKEPQALFYEAEAHFRKGELALGLSLLERYTSQPRTRPRHRVLGQIQLAAELFSAGDFLRAEELLKASEQVCRTKSFHRLLFRIFELRAQINLFKKDYAVAEYNLVLASAILKEHPGMNSFSVEKWTAILNFLKRPNTEDAAVGLRQMRKRALEIGHWESVRDCDLFRALALKDDRLFRKILCGSPQESDRELAMQLRGAHLLLPMRYTWVLGPRTNSDKKISLFDGLAKLSRTSTLNERTRLLNLYFELTRDFYRPCELGALFAKIYPGEDFNPFSSPPRLEKLLRRLDHWFLKSKLPLRLEITKSGIRLVATKRIALVLDTNCLGSARKRPQRAQNKKAA